MVGLEEAGKGTWKRLKIVIKVPLHAKGICETADGMNFSIFYAVVVVGHL